MVIITEECWITADDGLKIYTKTWKKESEKAISKIIFLHAHDHNCNLYDAFFRVLAARRFEVVAFDLRGDGHSVSKPEQRGDVGGTARIMADIQCVMAAHLPTSVPLFLFGHSMGGLAVLTYACLGPPAQLSQIRGFLGESPDLGLPQDAPTRPSKVALFGLRVLNLIRPSFKMNTPLMPSLLTRDEAAQKAYASDPLIHHLFSVEGIAGYFDRVTKLKTHQIRLAKEVKSVWIGHGTRDMCTECADSKRWVEEIGEVRDKEFRAYEGAFHNLHSDTHGVKEAFTEDVVSWMLARLE